MLLQHDKIGTLFFVSKKFKHVTVVGMIDRALNSCLTTKYVLIASYKWLWVFQSLAENDSDQLI